jgi:magnesium-transporting ATPase (P-type)
MDTVLGLKGDTGDTCWHGLTVEETRNRLDTSIENGLDAAKAQIRLDRSLSLRAHLANKYLPVGIGAVALLQILVTYAPPLQRIFNTEAILARAWPWLLVGGLMFFLLVETEKLIIRSSKLLRRTVSAAEAGT